MVMWCLCDRQGKAWLGWILDLELLASLAIWKIIGVLVVLWYARKPCSMLYFQVQLKVAKF